jgi:hypothetical protein
MLSSMDGRPPAFYLQYGLLTSRDNINFVAALNVEIEKLLPDAFRNGAVVILFVEPIPKVVILPPLSDSQRGIILWPYYVCGIGWFQRIESRSRKDQLSSTSKPTTMGRAGSSRFNCSMETSRATGLVRASVAGAICSEWNSVPQLFAVKRIRSVAIRVRQRLLMWLEELPAEGLTLQE